MKTSIITRKEVNGFYIKPIRGGYFAVISRFSASYTLCCSREEAEQTLAEQVEVEKQLIAKY